MKKNEKIFVKKQFGRFFWTLCKFSDIIYVVL